MSVLQIPTAEVFEPLLAPARYKGAHGGRGSGKSHFFAGLLIEECLVNKGMRAICIREVQKDLRDSAKLIIEDKLKAHGLGEPDGFKVFKSEIQTPGDGVIIFKGMTDYSTGGGTSQSLKSLEGFSRAWVEEAQTLSQQSLETLLPTIRAKGSEVWFSWNPRRKSDAVDKMFRGPVLPEGAVVVKANWKDNPWFNDSTMDLDRRNCLRLMPDQYPHIWEGEYATVLTGAYYAQALTQAKAENRIGQVAADPLMQYRAFWDIGVKDATAIWVAQFVGREIRVLDYYEASGQPLAVHLQWLRSNGFGNALCVLPHDGAETDTITAKRFADHIEAAGFKTDTVKNQGKGAALKRIESARRLFPSIWFNAQKCQPGLDALGWYHEKRDADRNVGLGPDHDWSSHGADAFGLMCVAYEEPKIKRSQSTASRYQGEGSWMG